MEVEYDYQDKQLTLYLNKSECRRGKVVIPEDEAREFASSILGSSQTREAQSKKGVKGGAARAQVLDSERRSEIARQAAQARWSK